MKPIDFVLVTGLVLLTQFGSPATHADAPTGLERVLPFTDERTVVVVHLDVRRVDVNAWAAAVLEFLADERDSMAQPVDQSRQAVQTWLSALMEAGGHDAYLMVSLSDLGIEPPISVAVPLGEGSDATRIGTILKQTGMFGNVKSETVRGCVVMAHEAVLERLKSAPQKTTRPFEVVFAAAPSGIMRVAAVPYDEAARVVDELMPTLPMAVGGGSSSAISRGLRWAVAALSPPPEWAIEIIIQSRTASDAEALRQVILQGLTNLGNVDEVKQRLPRWAELQAAIEPAIVGDTLRFRLEKNRLSDVVRTALMPVLREVKDKAHRAEILNQLKQIGLALMMYASDHDDKLPAHLADVIKYLGSARVLVLPNSSVQPPADLKRQSRDAQVAWVDENAYVVYVRPGASTREIKEPNQSILAHQKLNTCGEAFLGVLFADGHSEYMARQAFDRLIERSKSPNP